MSVKVKACLACQRNGRKTCRRTRLGEPCLKSPPSECVEMLRRARAAFRSGCTAPEGFRLAQLQALVTLLDEHECDFVDALGKDLRKPRFETVVSELILVKNEALHAMANLKKWLQPRQVERTLATTLDQRLVVSEPLGVVLIVGAGCSPVEQALGPLVGAIAAGNCALVVPYEHTSHTGELLCRLVRSYLDTECYHVLFAGVNNLAEVVELRFDHVFFIGGREDGRRVAQAAASTLTPVTLVLGGGNPCYVDRQCDLGVAARRIAWARFHNAGQSLVAPDYVLCHTAVREGLLRALKCCVSQFYGPTPQDSPSYGRMADPQSFSQTRDLLWRSGKVVVGGQVVEAERYIAPTILTDVVESDAIMQQGVSGPVLPVLSVAGVDEAVAFIGRREKPLCVYVYSSDDKVIARLMAETSSGTFCANDSAVQSMTVGLPCGGVGASGMGSYRGRSSFDAFSHRKSCLLRGTRFECVTYLRYPPYEERNLSLMAWASALSQRGQGWCQLM